MTWQQLQGLLIVALVIGAFFVIPKILKAIGEFLNSIVRPLAVVTVPPFVALLLLTVGSGKTYATWQGWAFAYGLLLAFWIFVIVSIRNGQK